MAVRAVAVVKLVILGILFLTSFILALRAAVVVKFAISGILPSIFFILALYTSFFTTSFFATLLSLLKSTRADSNLSASNLSTLLFPVYQYLIDLL